MSLYVSHHFNLKFSQLNQSKISPAASRLRTNSCRVFAAVSVGEDVPSYIPAALILLPGGPWHQIPGGVAAAKGFKAMVACVPDLALVACDLQGLRP